MTSSSQRSGRHQLRVPVGRPALVHDLGLALGQEVVGLLADDAEHVGLPALDRRVLEQEAEHVALGVGRDPLGGLALFFGLALLLFDELGRVDVLVEVGAIGLDPAGLGLGDGRLVALVLGSARARDLAEGQPWIDQVVDRVADVDEGLDLADAVAVHVPANPAGMVGHAVDHPPVGVREKPVVLEEVAVAGDVRHDQLLVDQAVALEQVGLARIGVDDQLVDLREPVRVALHQLVVLHAEAPMRIADREALVGRDLAHLLVVDELVDGRETVEAVLAGVAVDLGLQRAEVFGQAHQRPPFRNSRIESMMSSLVLISDVISSGCLLKAARRSLINCPEPYGDSTCP